MRLWELRLSSQSRSAYLASEKLPAANDVSGTSIVAVREAFRSEDLLPVEFELIASSGDSIESAPQDLPDALSWSWLVVFSERAMSLAVSLGSSRDEFWPCSFRSNPNEIFGIHLPSDCIDIVDVENSEFAILFPSDPPMPFGIEKLRIKDTSCEEIPPCFRVCIQGWNQVFGELFIRDDFKALWDELEFTGAEFRQLL